LLPAEAFQSSLDALADDVLEKETIELGRSINAAHARFALQVGEIDRRGLATYDHGLSTAGWLREFCQMTIRQASGLVRTAWSMTHMPTVTDRALEGGVPPRSMQLLGQVRDRNPEHFDNSESSFADSASSLSIGDLRYELSHWEQQVNYPKAVEHAEAQHERRNLYLTPLVDGMGDITGMLPPELFHTVTTVIDARVNPSWLDADDDRTPGQRRADAIGEICEFYATHNSDVVTSSGAKPHVTVTVDYETLKSSARLLPEIDDVAVTPETIRRITCDAGIIPMVLGSNSEPLDVGRKTRIIPAAIRRAIEHRDGGCTWKGCGAPLSWCDAHHITHWADGGETSAANLTLLCRKHHTATHNSNKAPPDT